MSHLLFFILMAATTGSNTFYRRLLPDSCVAFSSRRGRAYLESALRTRGLRSFYVLTEQHLTQSEPAYCGISTLVLALNALAVDPRRAWKGPWRWYEESMLNCCVDLESVKDTGITLNIFNCLAICQGLSTELNYATEDQRDESVSLEIFRQSVQEACVEKPLDDAETDSENDQNDFQETGVESVLIVSYSRQALGQTGSGHFSPIAAYDQESDSVLVLDTARFKYGAHWVRLPLLFDAMKPVDPDTGRSRGHILLLSTHRAMQAATAQTSPAVKSLAAEPTDHLPVAVLLRSEMKQNQVRRDLKHYLERWKGHSPTLADIERFCTKDGSDPYFVWELTMPNFLSCNGATETKQMVEDVRTVIHNLLVSNAPSQISTLQIGAPVRSNAPFIENRSSTRMCCKQIKLRPEEVIFIAYLACLSREERLAAVVGVQQYSPNLSSQACQQLLDEAELLRCAIDVSDSVVLGN